jgi:hypothetical protein
MEGGCETGELAARAILASLRVAAVQGGGVKSPTFSELSNSSGG